MSRVPVVASIGRFGRRARVALLATCIFALDGAVASAQESGIAVGTVAPDATLETLDGRPVTLKSFFGTKPVVLEFWATWCPVCKELEPTMETVQRKFGSRVAFVGVSVSVNQSVERVRRYTAEHLTGFTHLYDRRGQAVEVYDVPATSYVVVVDKAGKVVYTGLGGTQDLDAAITKALAPAAR